MTSYAKPGYAPTTSNQEYEVPLIEVNSQSTKSSCPSRSSKCSRNFYETDRNTSLSGSRRPVNLPVCPHCEAEHIRTRTKTHPNAATWAGVAVGAMVFLPLAVVPLLSDKMKKTDHYCQACGEKIGSVKPFEGCFVKEIS